MARHLDLIVKGNVQGVFFRTEAQKEAEELGLNGLVRNKDDGTVRIELEGDDRSIGQFIRWCEEGPEAADVEEVEVEEGGWKALSGFTIE